MTSIIIAGRTLDLRHPKSHPCLSSTFSKDEKALNGHLSDEEMGKTLSWNDPRVPEPLREKFGYSFCHLTDLEEDERTMAKGLFDHQGVAGHPGDYGMQCIANRILEKIFE